VCEEHGNPTRLGCAECSTPICPQCSVKTPVGFKCREHGGGGVRRRRVASRKWVVPLVFVLVVSAAYFVRQVGVSKPFKPACPTQPGPDVGIGDQARGSRWQEMARSPLCGRFAASVAWTGTELLIWGGQNCAGAECPLETAHRMADGAGYDPARNRWRQMAASPLAGRDAAATAWTGTAMVVWGGTNRDGPQADGAVYDPAADRWRPMAASPLSARAGAAAVWTGREVLVWGGSAGADGAAYDPAADRWRPLPASPLDARAGAVAAWTGREMVVWGGSAPADGATLDGGAAYDPARDAWRPIAAAPIAGRIAPASAWTGTELVVWGGNPDTSDVFGDGAAYNPATDRWRTLPAAPVRARSGALAAWTGTEMVLWGGLAPVDDGLDERETDRGGPPGLFRGDRFSFDPTVGPDRLMVPLGDGAGYNPATNSWRRLERVPLVARAYALGGWDGQGFMVWGGLVAVDFPASAADGARYTPA
jgi:N-acetylneuraminic acid mutarotase